MRSVRDDHQDVAGADPAAPLPPLLVAAERVLALRPGHQGGLIPVAALRWQQRHDANLEHAVCCWLRDGKPLAPWFGPWLL